MRTSTGTRRASPRSWSWPVFLGSFTWFFYRKMYAFGAALIFLPVLFSYLFGSAGASTWIQKEAVGTVLTIEWAISDNTLQ